MKTASNRSRKIRAIVALGTALYNVVALDWTYIAKVTSAMRGQYDRHCPICGFKGKFRAAGSPPRFDAKCGNCRSLERHRLFFLAIESAFPIKPGLSLLHFAPEPAVRAFMHGRVSKYVTADLYNEHVDINIDIEKISLPSESFDLIICSHVLEHVNDKLALAEMHRILKPAGVLYAMAPIVEGSENTYENSSITDPFLREVHFGQNDHVRIYGRNIRDRIADAGFTICEFTAEGVDAVEYGLLRGEKIFICTKSSNQNV